MIGNPTNIHCHARLMMVEQIMALHGRGSSDPRRYRRLLESFEIETLRRTLNESDFPALEEAAAHSLDARSKTPGANAPARETLTPQSTLP